MLGKQAGVLALLDLKFYTGRLQCSIFLSLKQNSITTKYDIVLYHPCFKRLRVIFLVEIINQFKIFTVSQRPCLTRLLLHLYNLAR